MPFEKEKWRMHPPFTLSCYMWCTCIISRIWSKMEALQMNLKNMSWNYNDSINFKFLGWVQLGIRRKMVICINTNNQNHHLLKFIPHNQAKLKSITKGMVILKIKKRSKFIERKVHDNNIGQYTYIHFEKEACIRVLDWRLRFPSFECYYVPNNFKKIQKSGKNSSIVIEADNI